MRVRLQLLIVTAAVALGGAVAAQPGETPPPADMEVAPAPVAATPEQSDKKLAEQCLAATETDAALRARVKNRLRREIHEEDANLMVKNKRHVVMSYAVLWALVVVFLVLLYLRQRALLDRISVLSRDLAEATKDDD